MSLILALSSTELQPGVDATIALGDSSYRFSNLWLSGSLEFSQGGNIVVDTANGLKIGTSTSQKIVFFNASPQSQLPNTTDLGTVLSLLGLRAAGSAYPLTSSGAMAFSGGVTLTSTGLTLTAVNIITDTTTGMKVGTVGGASGQKLGFWGTTPIVQPVLVTGASHTVDDVITVLQNLGLVRQS